MNHKKLLFGTTIFYFFTALNALAIEDEVKVFYKEGLNFEAPHFDSKLAVHLQPEFTSTDLDAEKDSSSFDVRRGALNLSGNLDDKQFSYMLGYDFANNDTNGKESNQAGTRSGSGELEDAWLQWNGDGANLRIGQTRVPFSRQELVNRGMKMFNTNTFINDLFAPSWQMGGLVHGPIGDAARYFIGGFNGESTGEARSQVGNDNQLSAVAALEASFGDYGLRTYEGDHREDKTSLAGTFGVSAIYGQGSGAPLYQRRNLFNLPGVQAAGENNFKNFQINLDGGTRYLGWDVQTELYYVRTDFDSKNSIFNHFGFYVQSGYMLDTNWEIGGRFAFFNPDADFTPVDTANEYGAVINYFINGHRLKLTTSLLAEQVDFQAGQGNDLTNYKIITGFSALL